jgi:NTE family protein
MRKAARKSKELGIALGGGAARSLTSIGVLRALEEEGISVDAIAASSGGALVGAIYAAGYPLEKLEELAVSITWRGITRFAFSRRGLLGPDGLEALIRNLVPVERFEDLAFPLKVIATDLDTGERVVISTGDLVSALMASCAIPGVFLPVKRDGKLLVDGGVSCNVPADVVRGMGSRVVLAIDATAGIRRLGEPYNLFQVIVQSVYSMSRHLTRYHLIHADVVVAPEMKGVGWEDLERTREIIEFGRQAMREKLPVLKNALRRRRFGRLFQRWFR